MHNKAKHIFQIVDYLIIGFKIFCFIYVAVEFVFSTSAMGKNMYSYFGIPYSVYAIIQIIRLFRRKMILVVLVEMVINTCSIALFSVNHIYFLILTILSFLMLFFSYRKAAGN